MSTREKIILSAVELFIEQGIDRTTTKQIATLAAVSEGSIYRYFKGKDEMAWLIFDEYHQHLAQQLFDSVKKQVGIEAQVEALITSFFTLADNDWLMFRYYLTSQHTHMNHVKGDVLTPYKVVMGVLQELMNNKEIKVKNIEVMAAMVMGAVHQIAVNKIYGRVNGDLAEYKTQVTSTIIKMLKNEGDVI